ncbi:MAG: EamA family transporter [Chloroflexi bacterium]|nr:EamA family transporter [Chloroflexota bacterium]
MFAWTILLSLGAIWGASYMFIKVGGAEIPPFTFVEGRTLIAAGALYAAMRLRAEKFPRDLKTWRALIAMGIFNGVIPYTLITWGETHISSGLAAILTAAMPVFSVIIAHFATRDERITLPKTLGILVGFIGVSVLFLPELRRGLQIEFWGEFGIVVSAASYALATIIARKNLMGMSHVVASTGQLASTAAMMLPFSLLFNNPFALQPSPAAIFSLLTLALLGTAIAYILYYWLIENTGATRTSLVTYLIPITGVIWGALLLNEKIEIEAIVAMVLIIAGVALVNRQAAPAIRPVIASRGAAKQSP